MVCYLNVWSVNKAKRDINELCRRRGYRNVASFYTPNKVLFFLSNLLTLAKLLFCLHRGDILLIQYPYKKFYAAFCRIAHIKGAKTVTLIHDLGSFRRHKLTEQQEIRRLSHTDFIIAHNPSMMKWLEEHGSKVPMVSLDVFDYLSEVPAEEPTAAESAEGLRIVYAGGLGRRKNSFIYDLEPYLPEEGMDLYGSGLEPEEAAKFRKIRYHGLIDSDGFIRTISDAWGVVWDGDSLDGCSGNWGEYLRYNNPHKASFYLRAGLPVIVWSQSAMAPYLTKENVGLAVDSLRDIKEAVSALSPERLAMMKVAAAGMQKRLAEGYYFNKAMAAALDYLKK